MKSFKLLVTFLNEFALPPMRQKEGDAGYDLYMTDEVLKIEPLTYKIAHTGIAIEIPQFLYGRIAPRSGLAAKYGIDIYAGVVDSGYRGELMVQLYNAGPETVVFRRYDRIAQLILEYLATPEVRIVNDLNESERGASGFGSTGQ